MKELNERLVNFAKTARKLAEELEEDDWSDRMKARIKEIRERKFVLMNGRLTSLEEELKAEMKAERYYIVDTSTHQFIYYKSPEDFFNNSYKYFFYHGDVKSYRSPIYAAEVLDKLPKDGSFEIVNEAVASVISNLNDQIDRLKTLLEENRKASNKKIAELNDRIDKLQKRLEENRNEGFRLIAEIRKDADEEIAELKKELELKNKLLEYLINEC